MDGVSGKAFGALGQFPIIQAAVAVLILLGCVYLIFRASKDRATPREQIPQWLIMWPLHDMMAAVHDTAEESRRATELLKEARDALLACKTMLELIRNESRMR
ncbi:hypothetical protein V4R08_04085 [Nitrobacter sp. NHB1]|uniref:hypothetical protein n=1 Tax=Nitrobacter sp. NHB1 TaxID=3119830 RepID=UPI0030001BF3